MNHKRPKKDLGVSGAMQFEIASICKSICYKIP